MNKFFYAILLVALSGLVSEGSCNSLTEARLSGFEKAVSGVTGEISGIKGEVSSIKEEVSEVKQGLEKMNKDIESLNEAVVKLVFAILDNKPAEMKNVHNVDKRSVISDNPLTNLPYGDISGLMGAPGKDGKDGLQGKDGLPGRDGLQGKDGLPGRDGLQGKDGLPGRDGLQGREGPTGPPGAPGPQGKDGLSLGAGGAVYSRWGRTTCGSDSTLLYAGYAGGSNFDQPGGGTNYQCMPLDPKYNKQSTDGKGESWIAGVEYQSGLSGMFPNSAYNQNAPCARCYTNNRSALMMMPAKRDCAEGWTKEYEGYLMTEYYNINHQTTFECVDENPEYVHGEGADTNGGLFNFIRTQCNRGGHCPPYEANKELTCVVCSK